MMVLIHSSTTKGKGKGINLIQCRPLHLSIFGGDLQPNPQQGTHPTLV